METPANVGVVTTASDIFLTWDPAAGATSYIVYSTADPYGSFIVDTSGSFSGESWTAPVSETKKFYYVVGSNAKGYSVPQNIRVQENKSVKPIIPIVRSRMKKVKK